jgi:YfiH family protein
LIEDSPFGRIVIPERLPAGKALFYTTIDFDGRQLNEIPGFVAQRFGIEATLNTCTQVHGATVVSVQSLLPAVRGTPTCDALWTADTHVALGIKVADCLPVTLMGGGVLANIHSGWRGTVQRITAITLDTIERETSFDPRTSFAFLGPSIRVCCFEVGEEVATQFDARFVDRSHAKPHVDVVRHTIELLIDRGFVARNIIDSGLCTRCDGSIFHSYRREGKGGGRNLAIAAQ